MIMYPTVKPLLLLWLAGLSAAALADDDPAAVARQAIATVCGQASSTLEQTAAAIPGSTPRAEEPVRARGAEIGWRRRLGLPGAAELSIERIAPGGALNRLMVEYLEPAPNGDLRPRLAAVTDGSCTIRAGRRLVYEADSPEAVAVEHLDHALIATGVREPLNPPVPEGGDPGGVPVALVDAGVNYLLPNVSRRLARNASGGILGYDFWDLDERPFDANPAASPFFPQRHGTKTATLLMQEAPMARLVPYRYPRPDMSRMTDLVRDAAAKGVIVVNMSMGSNDRGDWEAFAAAARSHPQMLFVLSAGNNGRDIDAQPVYPAALRLDNAIVVTSSEADGALAFGSNWGDRSVDLLVPAERLIVTGFDGAEVPASGSSYAAVRVSALAARLLARHPDWRAPELKAYVFARALAGFAGAAEGFMPRPDKADELPPMTRDGEITEVARHVFDARELYAGTGPVPGEYSFRPTLAFFEDTAWRVDDLQQYAIQAAGVLRGCDIYIPEMDVRVLDVPAAYQYFHEATAGELTRRQALPKPTVYFVKDTLQPDAYDAEAIGRSNSATRPALRYTVWFTESTRDPGIALAHELAHILMDSGEHVEVEGNLMRAETAPGNTRLTKDQCEAIQRAGTENGLLAEIREH